MGKPKHNQHRSISPASALFGSDSTFRLLIEQINDYALLTSTGEVATWNRGAQRILYLEPVPKTEDAEVLYIETQKA